ncbi:MAG TPA: hypothetical protein VEX17_03695 [Bacillales bacterium]|nr:hypothetical protein [Bacillales bacterium]
MENNLIEIFGEMVKESRDTPLNVVSDFKNNKFPKTPTEEEKALIELIQTLTTEQFHQLEKGIKYCVEFSLFSLIHRIENGESTYSFELFIQNGNEKAQLVGKNIDNELMYEYWNWLKEK